MKHICLKCKEKFEKKRGLRGRHAKYCKKCRVNIIKEGVRKRMRDNNQYPKCICSECNIPIAKEEDRIITTMQLREAGSHLSKTLYTHHTYCYYVK